MATDEPVSERSATMRTRSAGREKFAAAQAEDRNLEAVDAKHPCFSEWNLIDRTEQMSRDRERHATVPA
jgi:hypothetical protein